MDTTPNYSALATDVLPQCNQNREPVEYLSQRWPGNSRNSMPFDGKSSNQMDGQRFNVSIYNIPVIYTSWFPYTIGVWFIYPYTKLDVFLNREYTIFNHPLVFSIQSQWKTTCVDAHIARGFPSQRCEVCEVSSRGPTISVTKEEDLWGKGKPRFLRVFWWFPEMGVHQIAGWFVMENPSYLWMILGFPGFYETSIWWRTNW